MPAARSTDSGMAGAARLQNRSSPVFAYDLLQIPIERPPTDTHVLPNDGAPSGVREAMHTPGALLDARTREVMETQFGHDFGDVRVHTDAPAQDAHALAYTIGRDIMFGAGQYSPETGAGQRLLAHELGHVVQQRTGAAPMGAVQLAPADAIEVTLIEVSRAESDLLFNDFGVKLPGSPPRVQFGNDGPIAAGDQKAVQLAFDLAYTTAASPAFATKFSEFKKSSGPKAEANLPGLADLSQQKYLDALRRMTIHLADSSKNPNVSRFLQKEREAGERLPIAGFTQIGTSDVYIREFAIREGRDSLASLILHESVHVAGLPTKPINEFLETIMEVAIHGFESSVGLPASQIVENAAAIRKVQPRGQGVELEVSVTQPDSLPASTVRVEILDGNRRQVFLQERPAARFTEPFVWNGLDAAGRPTESGIHSIRVVAGDALLAAHDYVLRREKK